MSPPPGAVVAAPQKKAGRHARTSQPQQQVPSSPSASITPSTSEENNQKQEKQLVVAHEKEESKKPPVVPAVVITLPPVKLPRDQHPLVNGYSRVQVPSELFTSCSSSSPSSSSPSVPVITLSPHFLPRLRALSTNAEISHPAQEIGIPRGLVNGPGNACFVASVLQMLLQVPSFCSVCIHAAFTHANKRINEVLNKFHQKEENRRNIAANNSHNNSNNENENSKSENESNNSNNNKKKNNKRNKKEQEELEHEKKSSSSSSVLAPPPITLTSAGISGADEPTASLLGRWMMAYWQNAVTPISLPSLRVSSSPSPNSSQNQEQKQQEKTSSNIMSGAVQQDAHEFLQLLLERIDSDCSELGLRFHMKQVHQEGENENDDVELISGIEKEKLEKILLETETSTASSSSSSSSVVGGKVQNKSNKKKSAGGGGGDGWSVVGKGGTATKVSKIKQQQQQQLQKQSQEEEKQKQREESTPPSRLVFGGEFSITVKKSSSSAGEKLVEPFLMLSVAVASGNSIGTCVARSFAKEEVSSASSSNNNNKNSTVTRHARILTPPAHALFVHLMRWTCSAEGEVFKIDNTIRIDSTIHLAGNATYRVQSVLCHRGRSAGEGHFVTYVFGKNWQQKEQQEQQQAKKSNNNNQKRPPINCWVANDVRVSEVSDLSIIEKDSPYLVCYVRES